MEAISVQNLLVAYENNTIIEDMNLSIPKGKISIIIGANGCGKSTLLKTIARINKPKSGDIFINGNNTKKIKEKNIAKEVSFLPQGPTCPSGLTVRELVAFGRFPHQKMIGGLNEHDKKVIDWAISTSGYGITAFTDAGQEYIIDNIKSYLSSGNYYKAFDEFSNYCNSFIKEAKAGKPYDNNHRPKAKLSPLWIPLSIGIGAVISLIITLTMKKSLTSVKMERTANNYVDSGSINVTNCNDMFLYKNITRTAKPKNNTSSRGSSTHRSSSGRTHGGSSGKF